MNKKINNMAVVNVYGRCGNGKKENCFVSDTSNATVRALNGKLSVFAVCENV